ncbi:MAG: hypothetical protein ACRD02_12985, partial [Acidimicrobiia bacterium]
RDTRIVHRLELRDSNGNLIDPTSGGVSAKVTDSAGIEITGSPYSAVGAGVGLYDITILPANAATLDVYDVEWTALISTTNEKRRTQYEVVERFLFEISELREFNSQVTVGKYSSPKVARAREIAQETFETQCGVAFRPRGRRASLEGSGGQELLMGDLFPRKVVSGAIDDVALSSADLTDLELADWGVATRKERGIWPRGAQVDLVYEYGMDQAPAEVKRECMVLAGALLISSATPDRAVSMSTAGETFALSVAGRDGPTGIPSVDAVIARFDHTIPSLA